MQTLARSDSKVGAGPFHGVSTDSRRIGAGRQVDGSLFIEIDYAYDSMERRPKGTQIMHRRERSNVW